MTSTNNQEENSTNNPPKLINDRYEIISKLGEGGMGVVYKAFDPQLYQEVSIKLLKNIGDIEESARRFQKEAKAASQLSHSNLAPVLDFGVTEEGQLFMVSRFIEGKTLSQMIRQKGALPLAEAISIIKQIADCMAYIHSKGILHRDIKAGNIIVSKEDDEVHAFVLDFGIAKLVEEHILEDGVTSAGTILGSPSYMSPEQGMGQDLDFRSDIYSLGCLAFQMLTAKLPYNSDTVFDIIQLHVEAPIPAFQFESEEEKIPEEIEATVRQMLAKDPSERIQSMNEVADIFSGFLETYAPKHSWVLKEVEEDQSFFGNFTSFSSKTQTNTKIVICLVLLFVIGIGVTQLLNAFPRWIKKEKGVETASKHKIKERTILDSLSMSADAVINLEARIRKSHQKMFNHRETYFVVSSKEDKMPDWSKLKDAPQEFVLVLQAPSLKDSDLTQILMLKKLVGLSIALGDSLSPEQLQMISNKKSLQVLKLVGSPALEAEDIKFLRNLPKLSYLQFDDCNITYEKAIEIARIKSLEELYINNDKKISSKSIKYLLERLRKLLSISLEGAHIPDEMLIQIAKSKSLQSLTLTKTDITDDSIKVLVKGKSRISYLDAGKTNITRAGFLQLNKLKNLKEVALGQNPNLKKEEIQFLKKTAKFKVQIPYQSIQDVDALFDL